PLADKGWGWAASYHAPAGTLVQFRATSTAGDTDLSGCYHWTDAAPASCPGAPPPPPPPPPPSNGTFSATFKNVRGNEWWVDTDSARVPAGTGASPLAGSSVSALRPLC